MQYGLPEADTRLRGEERRIVLSRAAGPTPARARHERPGTE